MDVLAHRFHRQRPGNPLWSVSVHLILGIVVLLTLVPVAIIVAGSVSSEAAITEEGYRPWPQDFNVDAYTFLFRDPGQIWRSYLVSLVVTTTGTTVGLLITAMFAYALSRQNFKLRRWLAFLVFFTLLFRGGTVPLYILVTKVLQLKDTLWALILPGLTNPFYILLLAAFFRDIPAEFYDAAKVDGAGELRIFFQVAVPLAKPALATIGMLYVLQYWNDWFTPLLFIESPDKTPLQLLLHQTLVSVQFMQQNMTNLSGLERASIPAESVRMATAIIAAGPATLAFLFFQRYFIRGLTLGGLKGK